MQQISLSDPAWQTTLPHRIAPRPEEWFPGLLLRCDEANQWGTRTTLSYVLSAGPEKFHRCWRTDTPNLSVLIPSSLKIDYLAQLLALSTQALVDTTYQAEIARIVGMCRLHPNYLAHKFSFQVCPVCIAEDRILRREVVLPYLRFCSKHNIAFVKTCECGSTLRLFKKHAQPFTCYQCALHWSDLPRVEASLEEVILNQQFLDWYAFFLDHANLNMIKVVLKFISIYPLKRKLLYQEDLSESNRPYQSTRPGNWKSFSSLAPLSIIDTFPFLPPLSIVVALLIERNLFLEESIIKKLTPPAISSPKVYCRLAGPGKKYEPFFDLADIINSSNATPCLMFSPTVPLTIDHLPRGSLVFSVQLLVTQLYRFAHQDRISSLCYPLFPLITIALLAKLARANRVDALANWSQLKSIHFNGLMAFARPTMPYSRLWNCISDQAVDSQVLNGLLERFFQDQLPSMGVATRASVLLVLQGRIFEGTIPLRRTNGMQLVAVYLPEQGFIVTQMVVESNIIHVGAVPPLLAEANLNGIVVTGLDFVAELGISTQIVEAGGDYLWYVSVKQREFYNDIEELFIALPRGSRTAEPLLDREIVQQAEFHDNLFKMWRVTVGKGFPDHNDWPHLAQIFRLERWSVDWTGRSSYSVRYGVTSLPATVADAKQLLMLARSV